MTYVTSSQGRPIQGVSQQPEKTRLPGQCTVSENMRPDVVRGLTDRVGTEISALLPGAPTGADSKWYYYDRGTSEEYFVSIEKTNGKVRVWSPDGTAHTVNVSDNTEAAYLASSNPVRDLSLVTIGDYTFISNRTVTVAESATLTPARGNTAIIYVQFATYGDIITLFVNGIAIAEYRIPDGSSAAHINWTKPQKICEKLVEAMSGISSAVAGQAYWTSYVDLRTDYNFYQQDNTIAIARKDGTDFTINIQDDANNKNSVAIKGKVSSTELLPGVAPTGFLLEIDPPGASSNSNTNFWLKADNTMSDHITWKESIAPSIPVGMDPATMPHVLVRESIGAGGVATFSLRRGEWKDREVGSDATNPLPTFVGQVISSVGIVQNRLFFTAGESVILGRTSDFFNFFRETAQASLDTDPIDVFADVPQVNLLEHNVFFDGDLVFFSKNGQFIMDGSKPITKTNAVLRQVTTFETITGVPPVPSGDSILFPFQYGRTTGIREFFTDSITDTKKAKPVTDHVKQYIEGVPTIMKASTNLNVLMIRTDARSNELYAYDWLWQGPEKVQSAWGKLILKEGDVILDFEFAEELLWMVIYRAGDGVYVEKMDMGDPPDPYTGYTIRLDRKKEIIFTLDVPSASWSTPDPFPLTDVDQIVAVRTEGAYTEEIGTTIDFQRVGGNLVSTEWLGPDTTVKAVVGVRYLRKYNPTNPVALDQNGLALNLDRLTVGAFYMNYNTTGDVTVTLTADTGAVTTFEYGNRILGDTNNIVGFAPLIEGSHRTSVRKKSDRYELSYTTDSHLPLEVRDFEYNGNLNRRGRRI